MNERTFWGTELNQTKTNRIKKTQRIIDRVGVGAGVLFILLAIAGNIFMQSNAILISFFVLGAITFASSRILVSYYGRKRENMEVAFICRRL